MAKLINLQTVTMKDEALQQKVEAINNATGMLAVEAALDKQATAMVAHERQTLHDMVLNGAIVISYAKHWGRKLGFDKVAERFAAKGITRLDRSYFSLSAMYSFMMQRGIDLQQLGGENNWRAFYKLCHWKKIGTGKGATHIFAIEKPEYEDILARILAGKHTHKGPDGKDKITTWTDCIAPSIFSVIFGFNTDNKDTAPKIKFALGQFKDMPKGKVRGALKAWIKGMLNNDGKKASEVFAREFPVMLREVLDECIIKKTEPTPKRERRSKAIAPAPTPAAELNEALNTVNA